MQSVAVLMNPREWIPTISQKISGGLLLHKSTHHLDVINWWIDGDTLVGFALGELVFYGKECRSTR